MNNETRLFEYDWKDLVNKVISDVNDFMFEHGCIKSFHVIDSCGDDYAIVISSLSITAEDANEFWCNHR